MPEGTTETSDCLPIPEALSGRSSEEIAALKEAIRPLLEGVRQSGRALTVMDVTAVSGLPAFDAEPGVAAFSEPAAQEPLRGDWDAFADATRERTAQELCEHLLAQVERENGRWNAFSRVHSNEAMEQARRADTSRSLGGGFGPLHGVPVAVKDNIAVKGWPLTASSAVLAEERAAADAGVIERLRHAGAVLLGQTVMHELAFGMTSINPHLGPVRNPWDERRICGGSSGGSAAAVAAGLVPVALGSDTGGSIRCPAALCGLAGFKPSFGAVSRHGVVPLGTSLDTVGPLARTATQCLAVQRVLAGEDPRDDATLLAPRGARKTAPESLAGLRIGMPKPFFADAMEDDVRTQVNLAAERMQKAGARVESVEFPDLTALNHAASLTLLAEAAAVFAPMLARRDQIGADVRGRFEQGLLISATDHQQALRLRARWKEQVARLFAECDLLLTPALPVVAPLIDDPYVDFGGQRVDARTALSRYLRSINFLGLPAMVLPCGLDRKGLPVAVQLLGAGFEDEYVLRASILIEVALAFEAKPPA